MIEEESYKSKKRIRPDGKGKVTGKLRYLTDLSFPDMLYGKILRSKYPHARIHAIDTERAEQLPGVKAVVTYKDIQGLNGYGIVTPDQPVLCSDVVRYVGDAVATVAATSLEIAEHALTLIDVTYEELAVLDDPEKALSKEAPTLHPDGNVLHRAGYKKGDVTARFEKCAFIVEETYNVPRQMHAYMETEGGVVVPEEDGKLSIYMGTQHGYKDRFQLARILAMKEEDIRVVSSPMGGSFGGKDELNVQPYGALLAIATGCPVKIHQSRKESVISGIKRHPMRIKMKTGVDKDGKLIAHQVDILADTGAYSTLGPAILDFAVEHAAGPYMIDHVETSGLSVFTNNGVAGEFRGFGGNQITFALEGQLDRLADKIGVDPLEIRQRNIRQKADLGPMGHRIVENNGMDDTLQLIKKHIENKKAVEYLSTDKWKVRGMGTALAMHGGGLGYGRLDPAGGRMRLNKEGKIEIAFGFEEAGQGILSVIETIVTEELGCNVADLKIVIGDTNLVPSSGSTTASRGTSMVWTAIRKMKPAFQEKILRLASEIKGVDGENLRLGPGGVFDTSENCILTYQEAVLQARTEDFVVTTNFDFPTTPDPVDGGHYLYTFGATFAQVEIDLLTGKVKMIDLDQAIAAGPVVSQMGYVGQIEGGGVMALGYALMEDAIIDKGYYVTKNLDSYLIPSIEDVPFSMQTIAIENLEKGDVYGPRGVGEIGTVAVAPAIAQAIYNAIGYWVNRLPISSEEILFAANKRSEAEWEQVKV
ncbi:xanthine dehydrogenase subunit D [Paraliobacillus sediminis]|uniref:xanthine dehydrogenase subunit D n=1 Tax=Paraliobacillus sediminis TaxID=1885916 RepID=UPI000E3E2391|nr:xanthine dehydrogenase subunit D [Paraliobacillus sediminis]